MRTKTEKIVVQVSPFERQMLEHLALAERVSKSFVIQRLIRNAARDLYAVIDAARDPNAFPELAEEARDDGDTD